MFFLDSAGFFSLVSLFIQCVTAWVFVGFLSSLRPDRAVWLRRWRAAFVGLGLALTAMSLRFLLAHYHVADVQWVAEGAPLTRALYAIYVGGKFVFLAGLVGGIAALCGRRVPWGDRGWLPAVVGGVVGAALPSSSACLLAQSLPMAAGLGIGALWLRARPQEPRDFGRRMVAAVAAIWAGCWFVYGLCVLRVGLVVPADHWLWSAPLRINPVIDLTMQVLLGMGLVMIVMQEVQRSTIAALRERDRLREQVQRDEKMRALSTLVGGVAHEINNPLTAILGYSDELDAQDPEVRAEAAQVVREQADRCRHIVQRLSQLGSQVPLAPEEVAVAALVDRVARGFQPQFAQAGVELHQHAIGGDAAVRVDPTALEQVLTNLIANALQVSPRGGRVELLVRVSEEHLSLIVEDQGPGVPAPQRASIFEPFWTTKAVGQGTGLGLAVARALVQAHGGAIEVGEASGGGAAFEVRLPRSTNRIAEPEARTSAPVGDRDDLPACILPTAGRRLLVIDDEPFVRAVVERHARAQGWLVREAASAEEALQVLGGGAFFDAIVCDLRMPGIGGIGLHDRLAATAPQTLRRVVFVTGDLTSAETAAFAARCAAPIVAKPFVCAELFDQLVAAAGDPSPGIGVRPAGGRSGSPAGA
ncbi:MAG: hybrid sensor histidine kinase/response regulator [Planctomycetes bacterium]|nr:hybrid sensor histidine kinase/response regulator [Planctomycetota bacterium]